MGGDYLRENKTDFIGLYDSNVDSNTSLLLREDL